MKLQILGCYAATPRTITNPTSQVLEMKNHLFLIDCGEGTQVQLRKHKIKFSRINHIFISHLHGDHFYGLIGLISTFMLLNRENDLHVYGPKGIKEIILLQLRASGSFTGYNLYFHELESTASEVIFEDETVIVKTIPLNHRVYTNGFLFQEKVGKRHLNIEAVAKYKIEKCYFDKIKSGGSVTLCFRKVCRSGPQNHNGSCGQTKAWRGGAQNVFGSPAPRASPRPRPVGWRGPRLRGWSPPRRGNQTRARWRRSRCRPATCPVQTPTRFVAPPG